VSHSHLHQTSLHSKHQTGIGETQENIPQRSLIDNCDFFVDCFRNFAIEELPESGGSISTDHDAPPQKDRLSSTDLAISVGGIENLRQESLQLRSLLVGEIETLENIVVAKEVEAKSAQATASEYILKFGL
jgi:hypothetical protein